MKPTIRHLCMWFAALALASVAITTSFSQSGESDKTKPATAPHKQEATRVIPKVLPIQIPDALLREALLDLNRKADLAVTGQAESAIDVYTSLQGVLIHFAGYKFQHTAEALDLATCAVTTSLENALNRIHWVKTHKTDLAEFYDYAKEEAVGLGIKLTVQ